MNRKTVMKCGVKQVIVFSTTVTIYKLKTCRYFVTLSEFVMVNLNKTAGTLKTSNVRT